MRPLAAAAVALVVSALTVAVVPPQAAQAGINGLGDRPYMGWSSWSLEATTHAGYGRPWFNEQHVLQQADAMADKLASHGYEYINLDSGWQDWNVYDSYARPTANTATFPHGMKYIADYVHAKGLKFGLYMGAGLHSPAYKNGNAPIYGAPGCYTRDIVYPDLRPGNGWDNAYRMNFSTPCGQAYVNSVANLFASWGVDFFKLDGVGPGSDKSGPNYDNTAEVEAWAHALANSGRDVQFGISWSLSHTAADVWKQYTNNWRIDFDAECYCNTLVSWNRAVKQRWTDVVQWIPDAGPGHWNNLDALNVGNGSMDGLTDAERQSATTLWAIEAAPLFSGDDLTTLDDYGLSLLTNDEVIAIDQAGIPAKPISQATDQQVWYAANPDGTYTVALFNLADTPAKVTARWSDLGITGQAKVRDLWQHANLGNVKGAFSDTLAAHGSRLLRVTPRKPLVSPSTPLRVHATASTPSSVSLAWDPSIDIRAGVTGYDVYSGRAKVASVTGTSATVKGLRASTGYRFSVVARDSRGKSSAQSKVVSVRTPAGDPVSYEAEAPGNTIGGAASVVTCSACSGGAKVAALGGTGAGTLTFSGVTVPRAGTYLMTVAYLDGDSGRTAVVTVNGSAFNLPLPGTNDKNWNAVQTATVAVTLRAGANSIGFTNPTQAPPWSADPQQAGTAPEIDKIML